MTVMKEAPKNPFRKTVFSRNLAVSMTRQTMPTMLILLAPVKSVIIVRMTTFSMLLTIVVLMTTRFLVDPSRLTLDSIPEATLTSAVANVVFVKTVGTAGIRNSITSFVALRVKGVVIFM